MGDRRTVKANPFFPWTLPVPARQALSRMVANRRLVAVLGQIACPVGVSIQGTAGELKLNLERPGYVVSRVPAGGIAPRACGEPQKP